MIAATQWTTNAVNAVFSVFGISLIIVTTFCVWLIKKKTK